MTRQEGREREGRGVGVCRRVMAWVYDTVLLIGVLFAATALLLPFNGGEAFQPGQRLYSVTLFGLIFLYLNWFWTHGGQTPGMRAWRIRLCAERGGPAAWSQCAVRFLSAVLTLGLGTLWVWFDAGGRSVQDRVSHTVLRHES